MKLILVLLSDIIFFKNLESVIQIYYLPQGFVYYYTIFLNESNLFNNFLFMKKQFE